jgi:hypothetical protein
MEEYLKTFFERIDGEVLFYPEQPGEIELQPIGNGSSILKIYFRQLRSPLRLHNAWDNPMEIMLSNYPVTITDIKDLHDLSIAIEKGWSNNDCFTMLSMNDGMAIDNNRIRLTMNNDGSFKIDWFGHYRTYDEKWKAKDDVVLHLKALPKTGIITPICINYQGAEKAQYLAVGFSEIGDKIYRPGKSGEIQLKHLTSEITILKVHFPTLGVREDDDDFFENSTSLMLTNYPVSFKSLNELDGITLSIKEGWTDNAMYTMLSVYDGEPINNNRISFKKNENNSFTVTWRGCWGEGSYGVDTVFGELVAYVCEDVVTPLCAYDEELIEIFGNHRE